MKTKLDLTGLDEYVEALRQAGEEINPVARAALKEGGEILQAAMIARVPVDTGNLRDHILIFTPSREGDFNYVEVGILRDANFTDAETARQAVSVEYGNKFMKARSFVRSAIRANRTLIRDLFRARLRAKGLVE